MEYSIDSVFQKYHSVTNMSYSELLAWSKDACSRKASIGRTAIRRNLLL